MPVALSINLLFIEKYIYTYFIWPTYVEIYQNDHANAIHNNSEITTNYIKFNSCSPSKTKIIHIFLNTNKNDRILQMTKQYAKI